MTASQIALIMMFALGASFVQRVSGFGFGIFIMSMLPHLMPSYGEATALSGLLASVTSLAIVMRMHRHIAWRRLWPILTAFAIVSFGAVHLVSAIDNHLLKKILGVILIVVSLYFLFLRQRMVPKAGMPMQLSMGCLSGAMGGFCGMQGPPAALYFLAVSETKERYIALSQIYFLLGNIIMTLYRYGNGMLTFHVAQGFALGVPAVLVGTVLGSKVFNKLSRPMLQRIVYVYIGVSGIMALII
ncbi:MAG: sulfite exporter TauE/SafE family protein [Muribaculaceae bacterium]